MDKIFFEILACPFHRDEELIWHDEDGCFECTSCGRKYGVFQHRDTTIPNFLIDDGNWKRGYRKPKSDLIKKFQGSPFQRDVDFGQLVLDIGCGENARGNINMDCYFPKSVPQNFILANAEYLPFREDSIDIVLSNYNIEHLVSPAECIKAMYKIAKDKIEIVTDNCEWFGDVFFRIIGDGRIFHDEHYYKWSVDYFRNILNRLGFRNKKVYLLNLSDNAIVSIFSVLGKLPRIGNFFYRDLKAEISKD